MKNLLNILYVSVLIAGCNPLSVDPLAKYIIEEGTHDSYSYNYFNKRKDNIIAPILITGKRLEFSFMFKEYHKYDFTVKDGGDINKLYGITSINIHQNSARFGWRYVGNDNFEVFAYYYVRGVRDWKLVTTLKTDEIGYYTIDVSGHKYTFGLNGTWFTVYDTKNYVPYRSFPYFGGDNTAPHKMYFKIAEL